MDQLFWACKHCGLMNEPSVVVCAGCAADGRTADGAAPRREQRRAEHGWRDRLIAEERAKHPEWEKQSGESSRDYGLRMIQIMRGLSKEFSEKRMVNR